MTYAASMPISDIKDYFKEQHDIHVALQEDHQATLKSIFSVCWKASLMLRAYRDVICDIHGERKEYSTHEEFAALIDEFRGYYSAEHDQNKLDALNTILFDLDNRSRTYVY